MELSQAENQAAQTGETTDTFNFEVSDKPSSTTDWVPEGPTYNATEDDMKNFNLLIQNIKKENLWDRGPVKVITPQSYRDAISLETMEELRKRKIGKPYMQRVRKIDEEFYEITDGPTTSSFGRVKADELTVGHLFDHAIKKEEDEKKKKENARKKAKLTNVDDTPNPDADYWKTIRSAKMKKKYEAPIACYGSDVEVSNSKKDTGFLSVGHLGSLLQDINYRYGTVSQGITESSMYYGTDKSTFLLHVEDDDMFAICYHHYGAAKRWYGTRQEDAKRVNALAVEVAKRSKLLQHSNGHDCVAPLRHKIIMPDPELLRRNGIPLFKHDQRPGDIIIVAPEIFHMGYNQGINVAESVNFITKEWIYQGLLAKRCNRIKNQTIDMPLFVYELLYPKFHAYVNGELSVYHPKDKEKKMIQIPRPEIIVSTREENQFLAAGVTSVLAVATIANRQCAFVNYNGQHFWLARDELEKCSWWHDKDSNVKVPDEFFTWTEMEPPPMLVLGIRVKRDDSFAVAVGAAKGIDEGEVMCSDEQEIANRDDGEAMCSDQQEIANREEGEVMCSDEQEIANREEGEAVCSDEQEIANREEGEAVCSNQVLQSDEQKIAESKVAVKRRVGRPTINDVCAYCKKDLTFMANRKHRSRHVKRCRDKVCTDCNENYAVAIKLKRHKLVCNKKNMNIDRIES